MDKITETARYKNKNLIIFYILLFTAKFHQKQTMLTKCWISLQPDSEVFLTAQHLFCLLLS